MNIEINKEMGYLKESQTKIKLKKSQTKKLRGKPDQ